MKGSEKGKNSHIKQRRRESQRKRKKERGRRTPREGESQSKRQRERRKSAEGGNATKTKHEETKKDRTQAKQTKKVPLGGERGGSIPSLFGAQPPRSAEEMRGASELCPTGQGPSA